MKKKIILINQLLSPIDAQYRDRAVDNPMVESYELTFDDGLIITVSPLDYADCHSLREGDELFVYPQGDSEYVISRTELLPDELQELRREKRNVVVGAIVFIVLVAGLILAMFI